MVGCHTFNIRSWALEYHTLKLFSSRNHYEIKFILFSLWLLKSPGSYPEDRYSEWQEIELKED